MGALYRPPNAPLSVLEEPKSYLLKQCRSDSKVLLAGDFNLPLISWDSLSAGSKKSDSTQCLSGIAFTFDLVQIVQSYTRIQGNAMSILDCILLSSEYKEFSVEVLDEISDHKLALLELPLRFHRPQAMKSKVLDFNNADDVSIIDTLNWSLEKFTDHSEHCDANIDEPWHNFKTIVE